MIYFFLYALQKNIRVNLTHASVRNLMRGKSNIGCGMVLTKVFKKVKIDLKSKTPDKHKGDFNKSTLKMMKLPLIRPSDKYALIGDIVKEQLKIEEEEYPNFVSVKKKRKTDIVATKISEELKEEKDSKKRWKSRGEIE